MYADGNLMDSGEILESVSQKRLVMSWLNEWKPEFKAEGNSWCVYEIEPTGASAKLTLTHSIERSGFQVHRSRFGGLANGHVESQVAA
jgi:hypothetical protein